MKKMNNLKQQIQQKFVLLVNQIANRLKRIKVSLYLLFLSAILLLIAFVHIPYNNSGVEGILGFKWMTSFLFALALPLTQISSALIIKYISSKIEENIKTYFNRLSNLLLFTGFFFLLWTLVPYEIKKTFKSHHYYILVGFLSIALCFIAHYLHKGIVVIENRLRSIITRLFDFIILETEDKLDQSKIKQYNEEYQELISEVSDSI